MINKVLITGGAGFIGGHLVEYLCQKGYTVSVIDNLSAGSLNNLSNIINHINFIQEDVRNEDVLAKAIEKVDGVIHLAAVSSVELSTREPVICNEVNTDATLKLLELARKNNVKKLVFASTSAVYGNPVDKIICKETNVINPITPYAVSKLAAEQYCNVYSEIYGLPTVSFRLFNVFGNRQNAESEYSAVIPKFIDKLKNNDSPIIHGDGEQTRDFIYVNDVIRAFEIALTSDQTGIYNVASGNSYSVNTLYKILSELLNSDIKPAYSPPRLGDVKHSCADITLVQQKLNFSPKYSLKEGLKDLLCTKCKS